MTANRKKQAAHELWALRRQHRYIKASFKVTYKLSQLGQTDLVFGLWSEFNSSVGLCMQDYKSLSVAVTIRGNPG